MADDETTKLAWTGERFVPGEGGPVIACEHVHRYAAAASLVRDRDVIDFACGAGYGSAQLARDARSVVGVDIDEVAVCDAQLTYGGGTCRFIVGDMRQSGLGDGCADVVVCFEALEHVREGDLVVREARRLLRPDGLFIVSTPDRDTNDANRGEPNPFHAHEYSIDEFRELLLHSFDWVQLSTQVSSAGSIISTARAETTRATVFALEGASAVGWGNAPYMYVIAVCGSGAAPSSPLLAPSVLMDGTAQVLREHDELWRGWRILKARSRAETGTLRELLVQSEARVRSLQDQLAEAMAEIGAMREAEATPSGTHVRDH